MKEKGGTVADFSIKPNQYNILPRFFIKKCKVQLIGIVISIIPLVMWYYWHNHSHDNMMALSSEGQVINVFATNYGQVRQDTTNHITNLNNSDYSALTLLSISHAAIKQGNFIDAEKYLQKALAQTYEDNLRSLLTIRLAQVQLQLNDVTSTLKTLTNIKQQGWVTLAENTRGDAELIKNNYPAARNAYEKVLKMTTSRTLQTLVRIKLNNLPS